MSALEKNPPAFPVELDWSLEPGEAHQTGIDLARFPGMTLRDWFAGQMVSGNILPGSSPKEIAEWGYMVADAMLAERAKAGGAS